MTSTTNQPAQRDARRPTTAKEDVTAVVLESPPPLLELINTVDNHGNTGSLLLGGPAHLIEDTPSVGGRRGRRHLSANMQWIASEVSL